VRCDCHTLYVRWTPFDPIVIEVTEPADRPSVIFTPELLRRPFNLATEMHRPIKTSSLAALLALATVCAAHAGPPTATTVRYECDLHGVTGTMIAYVEPVRDTGIMWRSNPSPSPEVIGMPGTSYVYSGELRSASAHYVFMGRNKHADFTDLLAGARFRAQMNVLPDGSLIMVINPFGPGPTRYRCLPE